MDRSRPSKVAYLALPLLLALSLLEPRLSLSRTANQAALLAIILVVCGFVYVVITRECLNCCEDR